MMMLEISLYGAVILGLIASLCLFVGLKRHVHRLTGMERQRTEQRIEQMLRRLEEANRKPEPVFSSGPLPSSIHQNRRVQAVRLLRRGEDLAHVAAATNLPLAHVELIARVNQLASKAAAEFG